MRWAPIVPWLVLAGWLTACTSPEATRTRAGGPGADVGNRGEVVTMHGGSDPYWRTPRIDIAPGPRRGQSPK